MARKNISKKSKICLIYTGGTIGMTRDAKGILSPPKNPGSFIDLAPELKSLADFDFKLLMNKDSTNMVPGDWSHIATCVYDNLNKGYDGFVIAHGTDTMHFSASAVALALGKNLDVPVVFTGAQTAPDVQHGDARINLVRAFKVAATNLAEVVICFGDYVFRGCRAQKKDERRFDAFESPAGFPLGFITEEILIAPNAKKRGAATGPVKLRPEFACGIIQISLIPGLEPGLLEPFLTNECCNGVVLQSFGAGNVPSENAFALTDFIKRARKKGMPVLITSQFPANATLHSAYAPGQLAVDAGAIPTGNMTSACATAKFRWILAQVEKEAANLACEEKLAEIKKRMSKVYIDEMDKPNN